MAFSCQKFMKKITKKRLAEIIAFKDTDISDCPELTDEQLAQLKPSHYRKNMADCKPRPEKLYKNTI